MLKEANYRCWGYPMPGHPEFHKVVYYIEGNCCYFSGIERGTSTINAAEDVIQSIAKQEKVALISLRYFDIQTHKGYYKLPGKYQVNELKFRLGREMTEKETLKSIEKRFRCKVIKSNISGKKSVAECELIPTVHTWAKASLPENILELFKEHIGIDLKTMYADVVLEESEGLIGVSNSDNLFFFVHPDGTPISTERYKDMTPYHDGLAWVSKGNDQWFQIDTEGNIKAGPISGNELWPT